MEYDTERTTRQDKKRQRIAIVVSLMYLPNLEVDMRCRWHDNARGICNAFKFNYTSSRKGKERGSELRPN
jgi:hypothetical protein